MCLSKPPTNKESSVFLPQTRAPATPGSLFPALPHTGHHLFVPSADAAGTKEQLTVACFFLSLRACELVQRLSPTSSYCEDLWASLVAQTVKNLSAMQETRV